MSRHRRPPRALAILATGLTVFGTGAIAPPGAHAKPAAPAGSPDVNARIYATEAEAMTAARSTGQRIEVDALTTETQQVFANPGGTFTLEQRARSVRVRQNNRWVPVDTTLVPGPGGRLAPKAAAISLSLSGGGDTALVRLNRDDNELQFGWDRPLPRPVVAGDTATYPDVLPDVDLVIKADTEGFSEVLVVKTPEAVSNPDLATPRFTMTTRGLNVTTDRAGNISALDRDGKLVFAAPTARMWDSTGTAEPGTDAATRAFSPNRGARTAALPVRTRNGVLELTTDQGLLKDDDTKFPVYIDPSFVTGSRLAWTSVWKTFPNSKYWNSSDIARVGYSQEDNLTNRSFFRMDTSRVKGKNIIHATFQTWETHSWSCSARSVELWRTGSISSATTWNNQPSWLTKLDTISIAKGYSTSCPDGGVDFDATAGVRTAAAAKAADVTLGLRATDETDTFAWKKFRNNPTLSIEYNSTPSVPTNLSTSPGVPCSGGKIGNSDVALHAVPRDADGGTVTAEFNYWPIGGATVVRNVAVSSGNDAGTTITKTDLTDGATYNWRVRTKDGDGALSGWSATCAFTIDRTLPSADVDVASTQYPNYEVDGTPSTVPAGTPG